MPEPRTVTYHIRIPAWRVVIGALLLRIGTSTISAALRVMSRAKVSRN